MEKTYTPLFSEVLDRVHKAKTKDKKVAILKEYNTDSLRMLLKAAFDPKIEWVFPEGEVPYTPNDTPEGKEHTVMLEGIGARCVQHEIDHLNGIIFLQRASRLKLERAMKARVKERKKRLEYERRVALARHFQELQSKNAEKSNDTTDESGDNSVSQES